MAPISLALKGEQFANELWRYKNTQGFQQQQFETGLAAVLWRYLVFHEACLSRRCGTPFDLVSVVPSTSGRAQHPLSRIVGQLVGATNTRFQEVLAPTSVAASLGRAASPDRFTASDVRGRAVLLIDDTWTTGNHVQSAAAALKASGAVVVAAIVIGRHLNGQYQETAQHVAGAKLRRFSWDTCIVHSAPGSWHRSQPQQH
ncbi:hypothetical protein ACWCYY_30645 [Kitasatospora sp. NPDC001664]